MNLYGTLAAAALASAMVLGAGASAQALYRGHWYPGCNCGPATPITHYKTVRIAKSVTHFHDINKYRHVERIRRVTNVTRIQPVIHIHDVLRIHHHTIVDTRNVYSSVRQYLPPVSFVTHSTQNFHDCSCGW